MNQNAVTIKIYDIKISKVIFSIYLEKIMLGVYQDNDPWHCDYSD